MATVKKVANYFSVSAESLLYAEKQPEKPSVVPEFLRLISPISEKEINVIIAYRTHAEMQPAVDKLLELSEDGNVALYDAAKSSDNRKHKITTMTKERWDAIENAPDTDDKLL